MPETEGKKKVTDVSSKFLKIKTSDCQENKKLTKITRNKWQAGENSLSYFNKKKRQTHQNKNRQKPWKGN